MKRLVCGIWILTCLGFGTSPRAEEKYGLTLDIPQSPISDVFRQPGKTDSEEKSHMLFEVSSWSPARLELYSRLPSAGVFEVKSIPMITFGRVTEQHRSFGWLSFAWKYGLGFQMMKREGELAVGGIQGLQTQSVYLVPVVFGAELYPKALEWKWAAIHFDLGLRPTVGLTSSSPLADSELVFATPLEAGLGIEFRIWNELELELGSHWTFGKFQAVSLAGSGFRLGFRFRL